MNALRQMSLKGRRSASRQVHFSTSSAPPKPRFDSSQFGAPLSQTITQEQQDKEDEERRKEAMRDLVDSWMDRLQLISVITTFFASTEASMLSITAPSSGPMSRTAQAANIGLVGALVVHTNAAIISFLAAFFLIRYKLKVAKSEEKQVQGLTEKQHVDSPVSISPNDLEGANGHHHHSLHPPQSEHETDPIPGAVMTSSSLQDEPVWSRNPHLVQVGPFQRLPPTHLLGRCHSLCIFLSALGFVLALMGILCFAWDQLPLSVGISSSFFMALCLLATLVILFMPDPSEGTMSSHIYFQGDY